jgi:hypothetical protein
MDDLLTNGWFQSLIAAGAVLTLACFFVMLNNGSLRFPKPKFT